MGMIIKDGTGKSFTARVDSANRLHVDSLSSSIQHNTSHTNKQAYQVRGEATPISGTVIVLSLRNDSETQDMAITYVRLQSVGLSGGTVPPNELNHFDIAVDDRSWVSGGSVATPVNMYVGSTNAATNIACFTGDPTLSGVSLSIDRWYDEGLSKMRTFNKQASLIVGPKRSMEITYTSDNTSGVVQARVSFLLLDLAA